MQYAKCTALTYRVSHAGIQRTYPKGIKSFALTADSHDGLRTSDGGLGGVSRARGTRVVLLSSPLTCVERLDGQELDAFDISDKPQIAIKWADDWPEINAFEAILRIQQLILLRSSSTTWSNVEGSLFEPLSRGPRRSDVIKSARGGIKNLCTFKR